MSDANKDDQVDKEAVRKRMLEEAKKIRVRRSEGKYEYDNPHLEHKSSWGKKLDKLETDEKFKDKPKIQFHTLDDEGNLKFMQIKRDKVWTTLGWSIIGNLAGIGAVRYIENNSDKYKSLKHFKKREGMKVLSFLSMVALFTIYGYGNAQQHFVRQKLKIVEEHSIEASGK